MEAAERLALQIVAGCVCGLMALVALYIAAQKVRDLRRGVPREVHICKTDKGAKVARTVAKAAPDAVSSPCIPAALCCPITLALLRDPVRTTHGHVFERGVLQTWLRGPGRHTCPLTRLPLCTADVTSAPDVARAVAEWKKARRRFQQQQYRQRKRQQQGR
jgi:hypothetical protein